MRRTKRFSLIGAAALAVGLVGASSAFGDAAADNDSDTWLSVAPNYQSLSTPGPVTLFAQLETRDKDGTATVGNIHDQEVEVVNMHFDNSITFATSRAKRCNVAAGDLDDMTTEQALDACGAAQIGAGNATARVPTGLTPPAPPSTQADLTVSTFLGPVTTAGSGPGGDFLGGDEIMLHAVNNANQPTLPKVLVEAELTNSTGATDAPSIGLVAATEFNGGKMLFVPDAPDAGGSTPGDGALMLFNSTIGKATKYRKGDRRRTQHLVTVKCDDGNQLLNIQTRFEYDDTSVDTDNSGIQCGRK